LERGWTVSSRADGGFRSRRTGSAACRLGIAGDRTARHAAQLGGSGEELSKVVYRLIDAEQYRGQRVLVIGGGDSAVEAALACAAEPGTTVTVAYRGEAFNRLKARTRELIEAAGAAGRVDVRLKAETQRILPDAVELLIDGAPVTIGNDAVIVQAGGILPTALLRDLGVTVQTMAGPLNRTSAGRTRLMNDGPGGPLVGRCLDGTRIRCWDDVRHSFTQPNE
jgi:thioredoxin reductase